jgi:hypothetical protein
MGLRETVIGNGWGAEGYARALQRAGVAIAGVCGRTIERVRALATRLSVESVRSAGRSVLAEFKPDIVATATPGGPHREIAEVAAQQGFNILREKPMGANAAGARDMLTGIREASAKHANGAASWLEPVLIHLRALLADKSVGDLNGIDVETHIGLWHVLPYSWSRPLGQAGPLRYGRRGRPRAGGRSDRISRVCSWTCSLRLSITEHTRLVCAAGRGEEEGGWQPGRLVGQSLLVEKVAGFSQARSSGLLRMYRSSPLRIVGGSALASAALNTRRTFGFEKQEFCRRT